MTDLAALLAAAIDRGATLATAESCTGGMVAVALTEVPGSSAAFVAGFVTYSNAAKTAMLGVPEALIEAHGAVSEPVALAMAEGARARSGATLAVAITGIAGPGGSDFKPEGRVCFALAAEGRPALAETRDFGALGRGAVRAAARDHALALLAQALQAAAGP